MEAINNAKVFYETAKLYWHHPRPGEYVSYKEIAMLGIGWGAMYFSTTWGIGFGVGNQFTGMTLGMNNNQLLLMSYICQAIGYLLTPLNAYIIDNLRSRDGKFRVYIKLCVPSGLLTLLSLWLPYESVRDAKQPFTQYFMIAMLFLIGQIQGYIQNWYKTGVNNMVNVITPNTQERTKIMSIVSIIYSMAPTINNIYFPLMVDVLTKNANKYTMRFYRGAYTPVTVFAPLALFAYYGTKERLIIPKSRVTHMSFRSSLGAVAGNKIFWIKCADGWNDFLEGAKGDVWDWMVYRAHIMKSTTYGFLNTLCYNASFWAMLTSPWFIKKFGKKKIKIWKNTMQVFIIIGMAFTYKSRYATAFLFGLNAINRFVDCGEVIDKAIDADMRDNQQYLIGERIDGAFGFVQSYAGSVIGAVTGLFIPWVYKKEGFDGTDYSVLDVYKNYDETLPLSQQQKNPNCVLFQMLDVLFVISALGAAIDILPWFLYDISETGQKSMIRVIRLRTLVEDRKAQMLDSDAYIEGCETLLKAEEYYGQRPKRIPSKELIKQAKLLPSDTPEKAAARREAIKQTKKEIESIRTYNEEIEIADFVMREIHRFDTAFGKQQLALAQLIVSGGENAFFTCYEEAFKLAAALPKTAIKEERKWRSQDIRNAKMLRKSIKLVKKFYPEGVRTFNPQTYEDAFNLPDDTPEQAKIRTKTMKKAAKERDIFARVAAPYLAAKRILDLYEGYKNLDGITDDFQNVIDRRDARHAEEDAEHRRVTEEQRLDAERRKAEKRIKRQ